MHLYHPVHYIKIISTFWKHPSLRPFIIYPALEGYQASATAEIIRDILLPSYLIEEQLIEEQWKSWLGFLTVGTISVGQQPYLCNHTAFLCLGAAVQEADG